MRALFIGLALFFMGFGLSGSFPHGTMIVGGLSWDWLGGVVTGLGIGVMWIATSRDAAERITMVGGRSGDD